MREREKICKTVLLGSDNGNLYIIIFSINKRKRKAKIYPCFKNN